MIFEIRTCIGPTGCLAADLEEAVRLHYVERVLIDSDGGDSRSGLALAEIVETHKLPVKAHRAISSAALIAMSGLDRAIAEDGFIGVHPAWTAIAGGACELEARARDLQKVDEVLAVHIARRTRLSVADAANAIAIGKIWTAPEAVEDGLVDRIDPPAGLAIEPPERIIDGPEREFGTLQESATHYRHRAALEHVTATASCVDFPDPSIVGRLTEISSPPDRLAGIFDYEAGYAKRKALGSRCSPGPPRWLCDACGSLNLSPPAIAMKPTECWKCTPLTQEEPTP